MKYLTFIISLIFGTNLFCDLNLEKRIEAQKKIEKVFWYSYDKRFHKENLKGIQGICRNLNMQNFDSIRSELFKNVHIKSGNCEKDISSGIECLSSEEFKKVSSKFPSSPKISEIEETP